MNEQMRAEFEAWLKKQKDSEYCSENVKSLLFECWQASRQALVVELPEKWPLFTVDEVKDLLDLAGVSYK